MVAKNPEFRAIHQYYITRDKNHLKKKQSIIAVCCKLIRIFYAILSKGIVYDSMKMQELQHLLAEERKQQRQLKIKPHVDAFFVWVKSHLLEVLPKSETAKGFTYCINQEKYLRVFLDEGNVPLDNNAAESAIRSFCIGRANWHLIDMIEGAKAGAIIYSIVETAKSNRLKPYNYFEHLLTEIPKHMDDKSLDFLDDLLPWSEKLPETCRR